MNNRNNSQTRLVGCIRAADGGKSLPMLRVCAIAVESGARLAEAISVPHGEFVIVLPFGGALPGGASKRPSKRKMTAPDTAAEAAFHLPVQVQALDGQSRLLAEARLVVQPGQDSVVDLVVQGDALKDAFAVAEPAGELALLLPEALERLRRVVCDLVAVEPDGEETCCAAEGELPTWQSAALATLETALQPLEWVAALSGDARRTLAGDPAATARLRTALLGLGAGPEVVDAPDAVGGGFFTERPDVLRVIRTEELAPLVAAAIWAADDPAEAQAMLNGLAAMLWTAPWAEMLLQASQLNDPPVMRTMMGAPGGGWGLLPGFGLPGGGLPGGPGWPGGPGGSGIPGVPKDKKHPPVHVDTEIWDHVPFFHFPVNQMPDDKERCLIGAMVQVARLQRDTPHYEIRSLSNPQACRGQPLTLTGVNFGLYGSVVFPGVNAEVTSSQCELWSDTKIRLRVPMTAEPGDLRLSILVRDLDLCGRIFHVYKQGTSLTYFNGGVPGIQSFRVEYETGTVVAAPDSDVTVDFKTSIGEGVTAQLRVFRGTTQVNFFPILPGGMHTLTFRTPKVEQPTDLRVVLHVENGCGNTEQTITLVVAQQPNLIITQMEVTQAIQRLNNTVRLASHRRTMVRVYLSTELNNFSYTSATRALPGVTGTVKLIRAGQVIATVQPTVATPTTVQTVFFPYAREDLNSSLNFVLPSEHLSGPLALEVRVWVQDPPRGVVCTTNCSDLRFVNVNFEPVRGISLVKILVADDWRGLPMPTDAEFFASLQGAKARFPVPDDGWDIRIHPGMWHIHSDNDLSTEDGWDDLLEDLDDVAGDASDSWDHRWVGLLPAKQPGGPSFKINGNARTETTDRPWPLANDYLVMAVLAGTPSSFAHELGHTFGVDHSGCPAGGPNKPDYIDYSLPIGIEDYGLDVFSGQIFNRQEANEVMSYCGGEGRWTSIILWERLIDKLR